MEFKDVVKQFRIERGVTLRRFGEMIGVSHQTVADWEQGEYVPGKYRLLGIALEHGDWRRDFALKGLAVIDPENYAPDNGDVSMLIVSSQ